MPMKSRLGSVARSTAPGLMHARDEVRSLPQLRDELEALRHRCTVLEDEVRRLDVDLDESRALNRRAAKLLDSVGEHLGQAKA
jgi:hypothetical protein